MAKPLKSQWEFGELFPAEAIRRVLTVSELTGSIRRVLEKEVGRVCVMGEMTNLRIQPSGHVYFTIKDANAQLACVLFRMEAQAVHPSVLQDGQKVVVEGEITVYEARGQYQLRAVSVQAQGVGALQAAFERLKQKLQGEGLFDQGRKRAIPAYPRRIGLVTSPSGAAIRDVLHTIERRDPGLEIVLAPCRVQGTGAGAEVAAAIHLLNEWNAGHGRTLDLILVTRGGGSLEDLWAFNEEIVARAIHGSVLPVVCAVGHEIDFTIADFVADARAATPTAGAEIITQGMVAIRPFLLEVGLHLEELAVAECERKREQLQRQLKYLARLHPKRRLEEQAQRIDGLQNAIARCGRHHLERARTRWNALAHRLGRLHPDAVVERRRAELKPWEKRLAEAGRKRLSLSRERFERAVTRLELLSPEHVLQRGYSITLDPRTGQVVRNATQVRPGDAIRTRLKKGEITSVVREEPN